MEEILLNLVSKYPVAMSIFAMMGIMRAVFKPLMLTLEAYVGETESKKDDATLEKIKSSKIYKGLAYVLDYTASIKLPKKKDNV